MKPGKTARGRSRGQMSEAFVTAALVSVSGGLQDAYTYIQRGEVFANAQTGNIVLLSQSLFAGDWLRALRYLVPLLSFGAGVAMAEGIRWHSTGEGKIHWRQWVLLAEITLLFLVGFLPRGLDLAANAVVSLACAMQVQAFRKVEGNAFASTMCIGNLRSGVEALCAYHRAGDRALLRRAGEYFGIILLFALGAGLGSLLIPLWGMRAIWASCLLLAAGFLLMLREEDPAPRQEGGKG